MIRVMLATNDDHGNDTRSVRAMDFQWEDGRFLNLGSGGERVCIAHVEGEPGKDWRLRLSRRRYPIVGHQDWVGNWCWREVIVRDEVGEAMLEYMRGLSVWIAEAGTTEEFEWFNAKLATPDQPDDAA